jgi:hypothetical protein
MKPKKSQTRSYSDRTLKILWGRAAGRCAVPECRVELIVDATTHDPIVVIGDIAHIEASSNQGPRANRNLSAKDRNDYENLILLCKNCHCRFDAQKRANRVQDIKRLRRAHEAWVRTSLPERGRSLSGWRVLVLQGEHPIDTAQTVAALSPDYLRGKPTILTATNRDSWADSYSRIQKVISTYLSQGDPFDNRFAVFPLAPVTACLAAGYALTNRPRVRLFQYHRTKDSWIWPQSKSTGAKLKISGLPVNRSKRTGDVAVCFHLSAHICRADIPIPARSLLNLVDVTIATPSVHWLVSPDQLESLGNVAGDVFASLLARLPNASRWHIFFAGPAPGAVKVGQQINPTMAPPIQLYEFNRAGGRGYTQSALLGGTNP